MGFEIQRPPLRYFIIIVLFVSGCWIQNASAQKVETGEITYVTSTTAYVNLGSNQGFRAGDTLRVMKAGKTVAVLVVTSIASKSMATKIVTRTTKIVRGDAVKGAARHEPEKITPTVKIDSTQIKPPPVTGSVPSDAPSLMEEPVGTKVHGRVALQYYALTSSTTTGFDFSQPAVVFSLYAEKLFGLPLDFNLYSNHRYDARAQERRVGVASNRLRNRFYQASFRYGDARAPFSATVGRFIAPVIGGVGTFDGAMLVTRKGRWEAGLVGGSQPGYTNSEVDFNDPKFAAYLAYSAGDYQGTRYQGSLAFAQTYKHRALDRGFIYIQNTVSFGNELSFYQNANFDLYDITHEGGAGHLHLTDMFLSTTYRPARWLSTSATYAVRRNVYFLQSFRDFPDSLFDKSLQQNARLSVGVNLPAAMFLSLSGSLRLREGDSKSAASLAGRYTWANVLHSRVNLYLTGSMADNVYNTSLSYGFELNTDVIRSLYTALRFRQYSYTFSGGSRTLNRSTLSADIYYRISRTFYASLSYERYWESTITSDRLYTELTIRY